MKKTRLYVLKFIFQRLLFCDLNSKQQHYHVQIFI